MLLILNSAATPEDNRKRAEWRLTRPERRELGRQAKVGIPRQSTSLTSSKKERGNRKEEKKKKALSRIISQDLEMAKRLSTNPENPEGGGYRKIGFSGVAHRLFSLLGMRTQRTGTRQD